MCILLEKLGYRREEILRLDRIYIRRVLLSPDAVEDPKTGLPQFLSKGKGKQTWQQIGGKWDPELWKEKHRRRMRAARIPEEEIEKRLTDAVRQMQEMAKEAGIKQHAFSAAGVSNGQPRSEPVSADPR